MSTHQSLRFDTRPMPRRRTRRRGALSQFALVLALLAVAVLVSVQLNELALTLTR